MTAKIARFREAAASVGSQNFSRYRIFNIATNPDDAPWPNLSHNVATGFHARSDVLVIGSAAGPAPAHKIADLRRELADALGLKGTPILGQPVFFRCARICSVRAAIFK